MKILRDHEGLAIRLTDERLAHILEHPEMAAMEAAIAETLRHPERVVQSFSDPLVRLFCRHYLRTRGRRQVPVRRGEGPGSGCIRTDRVPNRPHQAGNDTMADERKRVKIWFDPEGDYLEVIFEQAPGLFPGDRKRPGDGEG